MPESSDPIPLEPESRDSWDLVFEQLGRRGLFRAGMTILALLYASAIYAPLIANDRPFRLEAVDYRGYTAALRTLSPVAATLERRLDQSAQEYEASRGPEAPETWEAALSADLAAVEQRFEVLEAALPKESLAAVVAYRDLLLEAVELGLGGDRERGRELAGQAKRAARDLRRTHAARLPEDVGQDGASEGIVLRATLSYPLLESLQPMDVGLMVAWLFVLGWPFWNRLFNRVLLGGRRESIRRWRRRKWGAVLTVSILASVAWGAASSGRGSPFDIAPYKEGLTQGDIVAHRPPLWPWLAMGYAETHAEEMFRPPTWTPNSEVDQQGYFVRGPRIPQVDPISGQLPPANPVQVRVGELPANHPWRHVAGTDELGRDFFVRMLWGGRVSLAVGLLSAVLLVGLGVVMGALAGYFGGWVDFAILRLIEILQSIPALFLILSAMAFVDPEVVSPMVAIVAVIALIRWTGVARLVRGEFLRLREQEFVLAARALGLSNRRTIFVHVLPNAINPVLVSAAFAVAAGILTESVVSFLGFGIQAPGASWGSLVNESKSVEHWWVQLFPGLLIFVTVTCYNLVGDALRDALDPRL